MGGINPGLFTLRWMMFVDGENFTIRAQSFAEKNHIDLVEGPSYHRDVFVWLPGYSPRSAALGGDNTLQAAGIRSSYYTSVTGDDDELRRVKDGLHALGFSPQVFKKERQQKRSKGVDIALTKDVLSHAFLQNYDAVVLVAGDADYVPLVEEVKRLGKVVRIVFFEGDGLSRELRRSSDICVDLSGAFRSSWVKRR